MQRVYSVCSPKPTNDQLALQETVFHNANGYLGVRGTLEEGAPQGMDTMRGAYVNGFYEIVPMKQAAFSDSTAPPKYKKGEFEWHANLFSSLWPPVWVAATAD